eukprot:scaffold95257_cov63-Phaeocystis_antarctica.AAC.1
MAAFDWRERRDWRGAAAPPSIYSASFFVRPLVLFERGVLLGPCASAPRIDDACVSRAGR